MDFRVCATITLLNYKIQPSLSGFKRNTEAERGDTPAAKMFDICAHQPE